MPSVDRRPRRHSRKGALVRVLAAGSERPVDPRASQESPTLLALRILHPKWAGRERCRTRGERIRNRCGHLRRLPKIARCVGACSHIVSRMYRSRRSEGPRQRHEPRSFLLFQHDRVARRRLLILDNYNVDGQGCGCFRDSSRSTKPRSSSH